MRQKKMGVVHGIQQLTDIEMDIAGLVPRYSGKAGMLNDFEKGASSIHCRAPL
jgi:hypothetical protein